MTAAENISLRQCASCGLIKPVEDFPRYKAGEERRRRICKKCQNASLHRVRATPEARKRRSAILHERRDRGIDRPAARRKAKAFRERYPEKATAQQEVRRALERGDLHKPATCQNCGEIPAPRRDGRSSLHGHHSDYAKPLDVEWLCQRCHVAKHKECCE